MADAATSHAPMTDPRLYRAALVPVLFALVLLAFSLENRPRPLTTTLAPDAFAGDRAFDARVRRRRASPTASPTAGPGSARRRAARRRRRGADARARGFRVRTIVARGRDDRRAALAAHGHRRARRARSTSASSSSRIATPPAARAEAELSATAALLELARVFGAPRQTQRTLTLVSTSGGSGGAAGAARARRRRCAGPFAGVLVLGDLASRNLRVPLLAPWSNRLGALAAAPAQRRCRTRCAWRPARGAQPPRALSQFARFAMPATYGEQGVLLARGLPAVALSIGGDRPPPAGAPISRERLTQLGRAALRTVTALDGAPRGRPGQPAGVERATS